MKLVRGSKWYLITITQCDYYSSAFLKDWPSLAPCFLSNFSTLLRSLRMAWSNGVNPSLSFALIGAPLLINKKGDRSIFQ